MSADSERGLSTLFVDVTGERRVVEEQAEEPSHDVLEERTLDTESLADGLGDAIDEAFTETDLIE